jgi:acetylornithine deacetylase/succinyl-diaminopimelate desuccinylase-like protein
VKKLGLNVKFLFDGEEELGSPNLEEVLESKKQFFTDIDVVIVSDGPADLSWRPTIVFGVRGIVTAQLCLQSAANDVHSGNFGGIQPNPALDLLQILQTMINDQGKCLIEGFYKNVFDPDSLAIEAANQLDRTPNMYKEILGISYFGGEQDRPLIHRVMFRPTFNIRGFHSGAVREQAKTIIPKDAVVELDMRLVPHQKPKKIEKLVITHLERLKQQSSRWAAVIDRCEIKFEASFSPMYTSLDLPWTEIIEDSLQEGFGQKPTKIPLLGGSLPLYKIYEATGKPLYVIPYAQPDQGNHAPNENLMLEWFEYGVRTSIKLLENLSRQK